MGGLTQKELKEIVHYDKDTGALTWNSSRYGVRKGAKAGGKDQYGYGEVRIKRKLYRIHRIAWLYMEGYLPEHQIDHINGVRDDNRWINLRHVTQLCNMQNQRTRADNSSGFSGVTWNRNNNNWRCQATINKKSVDLGSYPNIIEAALARFTFEQQCSKWTCGQRSELTQRITSMWPDFNKTTEKGGATWA